MKIIAICGSPRKGNTYSVLHTISENFPDIDLRIIMLKDLNFETCKGCYSCVLRGEERCPLEDDRDMLINEMAEADGVIFASPVYSHMVSSMMKNFFDRFGYLAHRPHYFEKFAMSLATGSGYGAEYAVRYMDKMAAVFGFNVVPSLELQVRPGKSKDKNRSFNEEKAAEAFSVFISGIEKGARTKPTLQSLVPFHIFKLVSELDPITSPADFAYYKDKEEYYYDTKVSPLKTFIAKRVARKEILGK